MAVSGPQIHRNRIRARKIFQTQDVRFCQIGDMDVIANTGAVARGIIVAKNLKCRPLALNGMKN